VDDRDGLPGNADCQRRDAAHLNAEANAACESFIKTLKYEEVLRNEYRDLAEAHASIQVFIEKVYNQKRLHSALGYLPPAEFEAQLRAKNMEAAAPQLVG
jgi:putative transposase